MELTEREYQLVILGLKALKVRYRNPLLKSVPNFDKEDAYKEVKKLEEKIKEEK